MMRSESSNNKLGRLDKVACFEICVETDQPRYRVQDGSWPNHKKVSCRLNIYAKSYQYRNQYKDFSIIPIPIPILGYLSY